MQPSLGVRSPALLLSSIDRRWVTSLPNRVEFEHLRALSVLLFYE